MGGKACLQPIKSQPTNLFFSCPTPKAGEGPAYRKLPLLFLSTAIALLAMSGIATVLKTARAQAKGRIVAVRVSIWQDVNATVQLEFVDWGTLEPGETKDFVCWIKSESNTKTSLTLATANWNPPIASDFLSLTWNYDGTAMEPDETRACILTLDVSSNVTGFTDFAFDIVIAAETWKGS